jgi:hypothetical protein
MARITRIETPVAKRYGPPLNGVTVQARTSKAVFSEPAFGGPESMVPGWDRYAGAGQSMARVADRAAMGLKCSPIGRGTLCCTKR